jgi:hypothetical protein
MKTCLRLLVACPFLLACVSAPGQASVVTPTLSGIVAVPEHRAALFISPRDHVWLQAGQRQYDFEVLEINPGKRSATVMAGGEKSVLTMATLTATNAPPNPELQMVDVPLSDFVKIYSDLSKRTALIYPYLPPVKISVTARATTAAEAVEAMDKSLAEHKIKVIPDGKKFMMIVPENIASNTEPKSDKLRETAPDDGSVPAGAVDFRGAQIAQAVEVYSALVGKKIVSREWTPPGQVIELRTATPLSKAEIIYALDVLFAWHNIRVVPAGADGLKVVNRPLK